MRPRGAIIDRDSTREIPVGYLVSPVALCGGAA